MPASAADSTDDSARRTRSTEAGTRTQCSICYPQPHSEPADAVLAVLEVAALDQPAIAEPTPDRRQVEAGEAIREGDAEGDLRGQSGSGQSIGQPRLGH